MRATGRAGHFHWREAMSRFIPVDPTVDAQGRIAVLDPILGDAAMPYPTAAQPVSDGIVARQFMYHTTLRGAASLGIADFFKLKVVGVYEAEIYNVAVGVPKFMTGAPPAGTKIISTMWGESLRVSMRVRTLVASAQGGFGSIAAAVELRAAEVEHSISAVGTDRAVFAEALLDDIGYIQQDRWT